MAVLGLFFACTSDKSAIQDTPDQEIAPVTSGKSTPESSEKTPPAEDPASTQAILARVAELMGRRDYPGALALFDSINQEDLAKTEIQILLAGILNSAGKSADAKNIVNKIIARESNNVDALMILADAAAIEGKDRDRRAVLEQIIKANPKHARALADLGNIALKGQSLRTAANYFDQALAVDGNYSDALIGRAIVYRYNKEPKQAEQLLNRAVRLFPSWASPLHERGRLYKGAGFFPDALRDFDAAKTLEPDNYWIAVDRGATLVDMNRKADALEEFTRAVALEPDVFIAYVYSAGIKDEMGDFDGAERDYAMLAKLKPEYYFAFEGLGILKMRKQQWAEARDAFLEAYRQAPKEYAYALLATINWIRDGKQTDPKQFLAQVLRTAPRESLEYAMLRLFHDMNGDLAAAARADSEKSFVVKARMLYYLANYYDIKGMKNLADKYFLQVQELDQRGIPEWRLNEWTIEERGIKPF